MGRALVDALLDSDLAQEDDRRIAQRMLAALKERLTKFGLVLHDEKTRLIEFGRLPAMARRQRGLRRPETFAFLGFTHICGTSRAGTFLILRHTVRERLREKLRQVKETIWRMMHRPIAEQGLYLKRVVNGFLNYFAVPTNSKAINSFYRHVGWYWCRALRRLRGRSTFP